MRTRHPEEMIVCEGCGDTFARGRNNKGEKKDPRRFCTYECSAKSTPRYRLDGTMMTASELAREAGLGSPGAMLYRLRRAGVLPGADVPTSVVLPKGYLVNGQSMTTQEVAAAAGVNQQTLLSQLRAEGIRRGGEIPVRLLDRRSYGRQGRRRSTESR